MARREQGMDIKSWRTPFHPGLNKLARAAAALAYLETMLLGLPQPESEIRPFGMAMLAIDMYLTGLSGLRMADEPDVRLLLTSGKPFEFVLSDPAQSRILLGPPSTDVAPITMDVERSSRSVLQRWNTLIEHIQKT